MFFVFLLIFFTSIARIADGFYINKGLIFFGGVLVLNKNFLKPLSFCILGDISISLMQNSCGFAANSKDLVNKEEFDASEGTSIDENLKLVKIDESEIQEEKVDGILKIVDGDKKEPEKLSQYGGETMDENLKPAEEQEKSVEAKLQKADQSPASEKIANNFDEELGKLPQGDANSKDIIDKNLKPTEEQEKDIETETQKKNERKTLEESLYKRITDREFEGFFGKTYLALKLPSIISAYTGLKVGELLRIDRWPEILRIIAFIFIYCVLTAFTYVVVLFSEIVALLCLVFGVKYLVQKSKEGINKLVDNTNINQNDAQESV